MTIHGCANGVGALFEPATGWDDFPNTGSAFKDYCQMVKSIFSNGSNQFITKMFMGSTYASQFYTFDTWAGSPTSLKLLAQEPQFSSIFGDPDFPVFVLDCFTWNDLGADQWKFSTLIRDNPAYFDLEYTEIYDLTTELLSHPNKIFVITDQEGDWSLISSVTNNLDDTHTIHWDRIDQMVVWHQTRQRAVRDAVAATSSTSVVMYSPEVNRVVDCLGNPSARRVATKVLRRLDVDMVAYSIYDSLFGLQPGEDAWHSSQGEMEKRFAQRFRDTTDLLQNVTGKPVIWSEWGFPLKEVPAGYSVESLASQVYSSAESLDVWGSVYWQVVDNTNRGFELWGPTGKKTPLSTTFKGLAS